MEEWQRLSGLIFDLTERYAGKLVIKITDARSPQAMWKAIRHGVRKYPTFIVQGEKYHGFDEGELTFNRQQTATSHLMVRTEAIHLPPDMAAENSGSLEHQDT